VDVREDYSSIHNVLYRFEEYKKEYPNEYRDSYTSLALAGLLEIFILYELATWNPLLNV
jgi:hypothetical protein